MSDNQDKLYIFPNFDSKTSLRRSFKTARLQGASYCISCWKITPGYWPESISACGGSTGQLLRVWPCLLLATSVKAQTDTRHLQPCGLSDREWRIPLVKPQTLQSGGAAEIRGPGKTHLAELHRLQLFEPTLFGSGAFPQGNAASFQPLENTDQKQEQL